ncbi:MAG TPA: 3-alpha domain-containing protein [Spirillospora sp.]|nr:3-alpha domain-containing protein [Spirillospora sp.]
MRVIEEGRIQAGDSINKTRTGAGALTVTAIDALLYLPGRDQDELRLATQIHALSPGLQQSFHDLLRTAETDARRPEPAEAAWTGFRPLEVTEVVRESATVSSIHLSGADGAPLPPPERAST